MEILINGPPVDEKVEDADWRDYLNGLDADSDESDSSDDSDDEENTKEPSIRIVDVNDAGAGDSDDRIDNDSVQKATTKQTVLRDAVIRSMAKLTRMKHCPRLEPIDEETCCEERGGTLPAMNIPRVVLQTIQPLDVPTSQCDVAKPTFDTMSTELTGPKIAMLAA
jgi:hypothetical protein